MKIRRDEQHSCRLAIATLCVVMFVGCQDKQPAMVPVGGTITFGGGPWPKPGRICFLPIKPAAGFSGHPGEAAFDTDGRFVVGTFTKDDGLMPGSYQIRIECWETLPAFGTPPAKSYVPTAYHTPPWTLDVEPGDKSSDLSYDVPRSQ